MVLGEALFGETRFQSTVIPSAKLVARTHDLDNGYRAADCLADQKGVKKEEVTSW